MKVVGIYFLSWLSSVNVESCSLAGGAPPVAVEPKKVKLRRQFKPGPNQYIPFDETTTEYNPFAQQITQNPAQAEANKFKNMKTTPKSTKEPVKTKARVEFAEDCDSISYYCLKVYDTGILCARSINSTYTTFNNYCLLDYVNCMERYEVWQVMHMGHCIDLKMLEYYVHYRYENDYWLDQQYVEDQ